LLEIEFAVGYIHLEGDKGGTRPFGGGRTLLSKRRPSEDMLTATEEEAATAATTNANDVITIAMTTSLPFSITCKYTKKCFIKSIRKWLYITMDIFGIVALLTSIQDLYLYQL
jgi:hypothetical protein